MSQVVIELRETFSCEALKQLIQGSALAVRVKNFISDAMCEAISRRMLDSKHFGYYETESARNIGRVGHALFEMTDSAERLLQYLEEAPAWMNDLRSECAPYPNPIDLCRLQSDAIWPGGATVARLCGRTMFAGLLRVFDEHSGAEPHQDHLDWDVAHLELQDAGAYYMAQMAANVYLTVPPRGGELVIWPTSLTRNEYETLRTPGSYGVRESELQSQPLVIKPEAGELIFFNSRNTHAVRPALGGKRITWSTFIGSNGEFQPLRFWS